jgi:uncharacterized protein involved in exopolysaccharide biosynthesis
MGVALGLAILTFFYARTLPNIYRSEVLLAPAEAAGRTTSGMASQYGGIASLAGISLPSDAGASRSQLAIEVLQSRRFLGDFVARHNLWVPLIASISWSWDTETLVIDPSLYDVDSEQWLRDPVPGRTAEPTALEAYNAMTALMRLEVDSDTGFVRLSFEHSSPVIAEEWLGLLVADVNEYIRQQDIREAKSSIAFLEKQVSETSLAELRAVLFELIKSQTETMMLAQVRPEYVFKVIDAPYIPEASVRPNRTLMVVAMFIFGGVAAAVLVIARALAANSSQK